MEYNFKDDQGINYRNLAYNTDTVNISVTVTIKGWAYRATTHNISLAYQLGTKFTAIKSQVLGSELVFLSQRAI